MSPCTKKESAGRVRLSVCLVRDAARCHPCASPSHRTSVVRYRRCRPFSMQSRPLLILRPLNTSFVWAWRLPPPGEGRAPRSLISPQSPSLPPPVPSRKHSADATAYIEEDSDAGAACAHSPPPVVFHPSRRDLHGARGEGNRQHTSYPRRPPPLPPSRHSTLAPPPSSASAPSSHSHSVTPPPRRPPPLAPCRVPTDGTTPGAMPRQSGWRAIAPRRAPS